MTAHPRISIVVASSNARHSAQACIESLLAQLEGTRSRAVGGVEGVRSVGAMEGTRSGAVGAMEGVRTSYAEILVVDNSTDGTFELLRERFPSLCIVRQPPERLIPELWTEGIRRTEGEIVAITTAHCVPASNWLESIRAAHRSQYAAVGGAIENGPGASLADWAVYLCRYSRYMLPLPAGPVGDIAGDNASYRRDALDACPETWVKGFWEPPVHAAIKKNGGQLALDPRVVVVHKRSFSAAGFTRNRLLHGMQFGAERAFRLSSLKRIAYILSTPAVGPLLFARIAKQCLARRAHLDKLALSLPILVLFLAAWTLGELTGALTGRHPHASH